MNRVSLVEPDAQRAFDYLGVRYSETARPRSIYPFQLTQYLTERHLSKYRGGKLLDLGCGRGEFLKGFLEQGFDGVGIDRQTSTFIDLSGRIQALDIESESLPFSTDSLDVIFNKSVLEHLTHISPVLNECMRVLKPGGTLLCMVPDFRSQWSHFYDDWTHVRPFTLTGLTECLMSHGYTIVSAQRFRQLPALWSHPYLSPLADLTSLLPAQFKRSKWVRFSKELMLLVAAQKPPAAG